MIKLHDSIGLPAFLLAGQLIMFQRNGLPDNPAAAKVTVGWTLFLVACLIQAIWQRKREAPSGPLADALPALSAPMSSDRE